MKVRLADIAAFTNGRAFKPSEWGDQGLPIIRIQNLNDQAKPFNYFDGKYVIENIFKETKDTKTGCWWPVHHWTDQKIKVHGLYCTITLLIRALLQMKTNQANINLSMRRLHEKLKGIKQVINIYPKPKGQGNRKQITTHTLTKMDETQEKLFELFQMDDYIAI